MLLCKMGMIIPIIIIALGMAGCAAMGPEEEINREDENIPADQHTNASIENNHGLPDQYIGPIAGYDLPICPPAQSYAGDGKYNIRVGDSIQASNGISVKITGQWPDPSVGVTYYFNADVYAGPEKLNLPPVRFTNNWCREIYGVYISMGGYDEADECGRMPLKVTSFFKGPIASRQDLYQRCLDNGHKHSVCADYVPWEAAPDEAVYDDGKFRVFVPQETDPMIGEFLLNQTSQCYRPLVDLFGVKEAAPAVGLRWYLDDGGWFSPAAHVAGHHISWPWVWGEDEAEQLLDEGTWDLNDAGCSEYTVAHELSQLLWDGMAYHYYLEEGLAAYAERAVTTKMFEGQPALKTELSAGDSIKLPVSQCKLTVKEIDEKNKKVSIASSDTTNWHGIHTIASYPEDEIVAVEDINDQMVKISVYNVPSKTIPWTIAPVCGETGYTEHYGFFTGSDFYYSVQDKPYPQPYESLSYPGGASSALDTAYCFWKNLSDIYGEGLIPQFLKNAENARKKALSGVDAEFCWVKSLNEIAGADLGTYFSKFDLPYEENDCTSWTEGGSYIDHNTVCPLDAK